MADIAQIGFASDSSGLVAAEQALDKLTPAAKRTEAAAAGVAGAISSASAAAAGLSQTTQNTSKMMVAASGGLNNVTTSVKQMNTAQQAAVKTMNVATGATTAQVNSNQALGKSITTVSTAHKAMSTQSMAAFHSLRSMAEQIAMGIPVTQIFAQQLNHLSYAASGPGGITKAFGDAIGMITGLLTPVRLLMLGVAGLAAGFAISVVSIINSSKQFDDFAKSIDMATGKLRSLQTTASFKGISNDDFAAGMKSFSDQVYNAQRNMGSLNGLMIANGMVAKTNEQYFANVADLVMRTTSNVQKQKILEAAGLPTTQKWVEYMSQGSKVIDAAAKATIQFDESAEANMVRKAKEFDDAWNKATTNMVNYFKSGITSIVGFLSSIEPPDWLKNAATMVAKGVFSTIVPGGAAILNAVSPKKKEGAFPSDRFGNFNQPSNGGALLDAAMNKRVAQAQGPQGKTQGELLAANQQAQQRISILGELATVNDLVKQKELELAAAGLQGVGVNEKKAAAIVNVTRATAEQNRVNQQAAAGIFVMKDAQKAASDTLQVWIDKGLVDKNNAEQMAAAHVVLARNINATSDAAAVAAAPLQQLKQLELDSSNLTKLLDGGLTNALTGLVSPIQDVANGVTSVSDGFKNMGIVVLKAIQEMIIKMLILAPIARALRAAFGGFLGDGGITSAVDPISGAFARGGAFSYGGVHAFASGGAFTNRLYDRPTPFMFAGGSKFGIMGEAGPEAVMPLRRGPNGSLGVQMFGSNTHSNENNMNVAYAPTYNLGGHVTQDDINQLKKAQAEDRKAFTARVARSMGEIRKRGGAL